MNWFQKRSWEREAKKLLNAFRDDVIKAMKSVDRNDATSPSDIISKSNYANKVSTLLGSKVGKLAQSEKNGKLVSELQQEMNKIRSGAIRSKAHSRFSVAQKGAIRYALNDVSQSIAAVVDQKNTAVNPAGINDISNAKELLDKVTQSNQQAVDAVKKNIYPVQMQIDRLQQSEDALQKQVDEQKAKMTERHSRSLDKLDSELKTLKSENPSHELDLAQLDLKHIYETIEFVGSGVDQGLEDERTRIVNIVNNLEAKIDRIAEIEQEIQTVKQTSLEGSKKLSGLEEKLAAVQTEKASLQDKVNGLEHDIAAINLTYQDEIKTLEEIAYPKVNEEGKATPVDPVAQIEPKTANLREVKPMSINDAINNRTLIESGKKIVEAGKARQQEPAAEKEQKFDREAETPSFKK